LALETVQLVTVTLPETLNQLLVTRGNKHTCR